MDHVDKIHAQWRRERPDLRLEPMVLVGRLSRLAQFWRREMDKTFAKHGLNMASFDVLATLRRSGSPFQLSPGDLLASAMVTSGTMTNRIDQLEKAGLVARTANPDDARSVLIALTDAGRAKIDLAVEDHLQTQTRLVAGFTAGEADMLNAIFRRTLEKAEAP